MTNPAFRTIRLYAITAGILAASLLLRQVCFADSPKRQKVIDFEDEVVEGMNKQPLDSLDAIADRDHRKHKPHLYRKRASFRTETVESLKEMRFE